MRISDWSSDVCSSDLAALRFEELAELVEGRLAALEASPGVGVRVRRVDGADEVAREAVALLEGVERLEGARQDHAAEVEEGRSNGHSGIVGSGIRSEEHTSELQSLMRTSDAVFCLQKK